MVGNDWVSPVDFWKIPPKQVWWVIEAKMPEQAKTRRSDLAEVVKMVKTAKAKEADNG
jgi:hypothetical protein